MIHIVLFNFCRVGFLLGLALRECDKTIKLSFEKMLSYEMRDFHRSDAFEILLLIFSINY